MLLSVMKFFPYVSMLSHISTYPLIGLIFFLLVKHLTLKEQLVLTPLTPSSFLFVSDLALTNLVGDRCILRVSHVTFNREDFWAVEDRLIHGFIN